MKVIIFIQIILFECALTSAAQPPNIQWQKCFGGSDEEYINDIKEISDGYVGVGITLSNDGDVTGNYGNADGWIIKCDTIGNLVWQKCYGGSGFDQLYSIDTCFNNCFIICGSTQSNDFGAIGNHGMTDYFVILIDSVGNILWSKCFGGTDEDIAYQVKPTKDGGFMVAGESNSVDGDVSGNHGDDAWMLKLNALGDISWQKCFGGSGWDVANGVYQYADSSYALCGHTRSTDGDIGGTNGGDDFWVLRYDSLGNFISSSTYGGSLSDFAYTSDINETALLVSGETLSNDIDVNGYHGNGFPDIWTIAVNNNDIITNKKCIGGTGPEYPYGIQFDNDGGVIISGQTGSNDGDVSGNHSFGFDIWIVKLDTMFDIKWAKCLGGTGDEQIGNICTTSDSGYIVSGSTSSTDGDVSGGGFHGNIDAWLVKLSTIEASVSEINYNKIISAYITRSNVLQLKYYSEKPQIINLVLYDALGHCLLKKVLNNNAGENSFEIPVDLNNGIYIIHVNLYLGLFLT